MYAPKTDNKNKNYRSMSSWLGVVKFMSQKEQSVDEIELIHKEREELEQKIKEMQARIKELD